MLYHRPARDNQSLSVIMFSVSGYVFGLCVMTVPKAASHHGGKPRVQCDKVKCFLDYTTVQISYVLYASITVTNVKFVKKLIQFLHWI